MRRIFIYIALILIGAIAFAQSAMPDPAPETDTEPGTSDASMPDSITSMPDSLAWPDSVPVQLVQPDPLPMDREPIGHDSMVSDRRGISRLRREKVDLDNSVTFSAADSLVLVGRNDAYLYGDGTVEYGEFKINAAEIRMLMDSTTVYAQGAPDSVGQLQGKPVFRDGNGEYESNTMKYNFRTQRGFITGVVTEQGEGYLTGGTTKKMEDGSFYVEGGRYTTCDDHDHPHFYFQLTRARMRPKKDVVSGPVYMVLADVPLPLALPFGYFPFSKDYSSGIIMPTFGDDYNRGFYLRDGGYYFAINDNVDLALRGELYTKGSWGVSARSTYAKRYRFRGSFDISYITTITGDKDAPDYAKQNNFRVVWNHSQDAKANPNMSFSAAVNFTTSGYTRNDLNSYYNSSFTENTKSSTVNMTYRFPGTKWSLSTTANITQRTQDSTLAVSFPNVNVSLSQLAPFKRKVSVGGEKWYEKIRLSYSGQFQNSLTARQDQFFKKSLIKDWRNGMKHYMPVSATFSLFKYINISPSVTLNDRMYTSRIRRQWDPNASAEVQDTTYGFYNVFDFNASLSFDTKVYGFFKPWKVFGDRVQMIRHVLTPTVSLSAAPDFSAPGWGAYGRYDYVDNAGNPAQRVYPYYSHTIFGGPSAGRQGIVSVNLANNLEMKVRSDKDSTGYKKISLIENFTIGQSYNFAADSMNWSNLTTSIMLRLVRNFNLNLNATWDPYTYRLSPSGTPVHVNVPRWKAGKGWVKLVSTGTSFSYTFNNSTFRRKSSGSSDRGTSSSDTGYDDGDLPPDSEGDDTDGDSFAAAARARREKSRKDSAEEDADGYADWECPWSLTLNYSVNYGLGTFNYDKMDYNGRFTQNLSFSGNIRPTKNWNFSFSASYDFQAHKIAYMNCSISRDLHCFTMSASVVPVGPYKSYNFHIAVKSSLLSDLKYDKRSSSSNGINWY